MARSPWGHRRSSTCRSLWSGHHHGCCAVRARARRTPSQTSSGSIADQHVSRAAGHGGPHFRGQSRRLTSAQATVRMAGCEAPVPTPPVSPQGRPRCGLAQHLNRGPGLRRDAAQAQQWAAAAWTPELPRSQSPTRPTGSTAQRHFVSWMSEYSDDAGFSHHLVHAACPLGQPKGA